VREDLPVPPTTFPEALRDTAWRTPDATFLRWSDRNQSITYAEGEALAEKSAGALHALGVERGDRVGILAHNGLDYVAAMLGAWKLGAISTHISVLVHDELSQYVNAATPKVLVYTHDMLPAIDRDRVSMPSIEHYLCMDGAQPGAQAWSEVLQNAPTAPVVQVQDSWPAHLSFTSGSTGRPKGAVLEHGHTIRASARIAERLELGPHDRSLGPTGLASSYALVVNLLPGIVAGMSIGLRSRFDAASVWDDMESDGTTYFPANPPFLADLLAESRKRGRAPGALRIVTSGGAAVPPELKRAYFDELNVSFCESYGQSELGGFVALGSPLRPADSQLKEVLVVDDAGIPVPAGKPGEMIIRGGYMWGYWDEPEKTALAIRNGWLHTGDLGTMDIYGFITNLGRASERIVTVDGPVFPRPIEEALGRHPSVRYVAVIPIDEQPAAVVSLWPHQNVISADQLLAFFATQPDFDARLRRIELIETMPMTPTGKLDKMTLRSAFSPTAV
jgi:long-chain acyl-CoA synthetase